MKVSTKGRYALRMMIDLAVHYQGKPVALKEIADRQQISKKYLEQIIPSFTKSGIMFAERGFHGGYVLSKAPDEITVLEILRLTEGDFNIVACVADEPVPCERKSICATYKMWKGLSDVINEYLDSVTLQDLVDEAEPTDNYVI